MAKNIDFMGATFPDVPSIRLPQHEGGLVAFDDTTDATATADKILQGYTAYANGEKLVGTASGGSAVIEPLSVTANGTYSAPSGVDGYSPVTVNVSGGGGGSSNVVQGTFTTGSTRSSIGSVAIPYDGIGYPIALMVYVDGGMYNNTTGGNTDWYNSKNRYDAGAFYMTKAQITTAPDYASATTNNYGVVTVTYKNSTSSGTTYTRNGANTSTYSTLTPSNSNTCVRLSDDKTISYKIGNLTSGTIGLAPDTKYAYIVVYSE